MKRFAVTIFLSFFISRAPAQIAKIDSLNRLISKAVTDTGRINLLVKKIKLIRNENIDSAIQLGKVTLQEAQKKGYYKGIIDLRNSLAASYCFKGNYKSAEENLRFLGTFIKPSKDSAEYAGLYSSYGMMYGMQLKYDTSIQFYEKSIGIYERNNNKLSLASNYSNIAIGFQQLSNFAQALFFQQKSLKLAEDNNDEPTEAYTLVNMGITYTLIRDSLRAEQSYRKSITLAEKNNITDVELYAYTNLSGLYMNKDQWKNAYEFAMKAASLASKMGDQGTQAASLSKAAVCLANLGKFSEATYLGQKAIVIADSSAQTLSLYQGYSSLGNILKLQKKYAEAIALYEKGFKALKETDAYESDIGLSYKDLSECYEQNGNFNQALATYKKFALIEDSVRSKDNIQKATELNMNYEFSKKQEIADVLQGKKNAEAHFRQLILLAGLGLTLILAVVAWLAFRNKQKANQLLQEQKAEIQITLTRLEATQAQLIQSEKMASLGELTAGIAHEIQNPLNFVNNFSEVNTELIEELKNQQQMHPRDFENENGFLNDIRENEQKINHHGKRADAIVKGMLLHSRASTGIKQPTDINNLAEEYFRLSYHGLRAKDKTFNATLETDFDTGVEKVNVIRQDIGRVLLNLFTNAFYSVNEKAIASTDTAAPELPKYKPVVLVSTKKTGNKIQISVKDNGNGIPQKVLDKIYQPFFTTKPAGQGTGLGLSLSYDIIKAHGGEIKVETKEGEGATFTIQLPGAWKKDV